MWLLVVSVYGMRVKLTSIWWWLTLDSLLICSVLNQNFGQTSSSSQLGYFSTVFVEHQCHGRSVIGWKRIMWHSHMYILMIFAACNSRWNLFLWEALSCVNLSRFSQMITMRCRWWLAVKIIIDGYELIISASNEIETWVQQYSDKKSMEHAALFIENPINYVIRP